MAKLLLAVIAKVYCHYCQFLIAGFDHALH